jgi:hypothetical protein
LVEMVFVEGRAPAQQGCCGAVGGQAHHAQDGDTWTQDSGQDLPQPQLGGLGYP